MLIYERLVPRWKYSQKKHETIRLLGVEAWAALVECIFDFLATPLYEPELELLADLLLHIVRLQKENSPDMSTDPVSLYKAAEACQALFIPIPLLCDRIKENTRKHMWRGMNIIHGTSNYTSGRPSVSG